MSTRHSFDSEQSVGELISNSLEECNKQMHDKKYFPPVFRQLSVVYTGGLDDVSFTNNFEF
mgnify:CR=1 FL=1